MRRAAFPARAHARSGDSVAIGSYLGGNDTFDEAMLSFSELYAEQVGRDFQTFLRAIAPAREFAYQVG